MQMTHCLPSPSSMLYSCVRDDLSILSVDRPALTAPAMAGSVLRCLKQCFGLISSLSRTLFLPSRSWWLCSRGWSFWACTPLLCWSCWSPVPPASLHPDHLALPGAARIHPLQASWHVSTHVTDTGQAGHVPQSHPHAVHAVQALPCWGLPELVAGYSFLEARTQNYTTQSASDTWYSSLLSINSRTSVDTLDPITSLEQCHTAVVDA